MHILHLKDTLEVGGISAVLHTLIATTPQEQHTVATFSPGPFAEKIEALNTPVHHLTPQSYRAVADFVKEVKPDVIHALGFTMLRYARLLHRLTGVPVVCGIHGDLNKIGRLQRHVQHLLMKVMGNWCSGYLCVSEEVRRVLRTKLPRSFPSQKAHVVHNGITLADIKPDTRITRTGVGLPEDRFIIGSVGRLSREKSYDLLLRSAAPLCRAKKAVICLVGDGPEHGRLVRVAHDLYIADDVYFMGRQTPSAPWYFLFDCFALSSQTEGLSIALLEALAAGLPVVSTCNFNPETSSVTLATSRVQTMNDSFSGLWTSQSDNYHPVITHNTNGLLAPVNNEEALRTELEKIIDNDALRARLKKEALNSVKKFSAQSMAEKYVTIFKASQ